MKIAIQGHPTRGKEVIQILESLGGKNNTLFKGVKGFWYFIDSDGHIRNDYQIVLIHAGFKTYTLEEFEKEFPFKIGDEVIIPDYSNKKGTIINIDCGGPTLSYFIKLETGNGIYRSTKFIKFHKEMNEERNITLTLDKAKEWYKKGGELKEIALQAFTEKELNPLPRSWEEFYKQDNPIASWRYTIPIKYEVLFKLEQLRDCWRQGNIPRGLKYKIRKTENKYTVLWGPEDAFLSFCDRQTAEEFLECFRDLIEQAGDLI